MGGGRRRPGTEQGRWWLAPGAGGGVVPRGRCSSGACHRPPSGSRSVQGAGGRAGPHRVALQALTVLQPHGVDLTGLVTLADLRRALETRSA